jgi:predicted nucleic acid-binding protein
MSDERILLDTGFVRALLNRRDHLHPKATELWPRVRAAREVWTTEAILVEIGNSLSSSSHRRAAYAFISKCYTTSNTRIVNVISDLLARALARYDSRSDKTWGLTDCISFIVMEEQNLMDAMTPDKDFQQAGFRALMREDQS